MPLLTIQIMLASLLCSSMLHLGQIILKISNAPDKLVVQHALRKQQIHLPANVKLLFPPFSSFPIIKIPSFFAPHANKIYNFKFVCLSIFCF
mmetsp:Transcript_40679/g.95501  ORF Transcript_40679/g.95501 Transcript_40679/m.95501 type:complete len:92 (+) Transcript_40679:240-515(+)